LILRRSLSKQEDYGINHNGKRKDIGEVLEGPVPTVVSPQIRVGGCDDMIRGKDKCDYNKGDTVAEIY
jgi:hypothetical protein